MLELVKPALLKVLSSIGTLLYYLLYTLYEKYMAKKTIKRLLQTLVKW